MKKLKGKRALITGASQGLGKALASVYLTEGADVVICARNAKDLTAAGKELSQNLIKTLDHSQKLLTQVADVSKANEVEALIEYTLKNLGGIDVLICNAGIYGPKGPISTLNWEEWEKAIQVNLMGTVLPCRFVLPHMIRAKSGKIIALSGGGATKPLPFLSSYAASKAAVVRFVETLAEEVRDQGINVNAVAPGALNTRLLEEVLDAGPQVVGEDFYNKSVIQKKEGGSSLEHAANLCVFLGTSASNGITGKLISAVWDPWAKLSELPELKEKIEKTDIYTLRRIVPEDRGCLV